MFLKKTETGKACQDKITADKYGTDIFVGEFYLNFNWIFLWHHVNPDFVVSWQESRSESTSPPSSNHLNSVIICSIQLQSAFGLQFYELIRFEINTRHCGVNQWWQQMAPSLTSLKSSWCWWKGGRVVYSRLIVFHCVTLSMKNRKIGATKTEQIVDNKRNNTDK